MHGSGDPCDWAGPRTHVYPKYTSRISNAYQILNLRALAHSRTMHPSHAGGMALVTSRQMTIATVIMPEACTNTGADTSQISRIAKHEHAYVKNTPDHPTCISYTMTMAQRQGFRYMDICL